MMTREEIEDAVREDHRGCYDCYYQEKSCECSAKLTIDRLVSMQAETATLREGLIRLLAAADCIRHWHDTGRDNEGMIVSSQKVRDLWQVAAEIRREFKLEGE